MVAANKKKLNHSKFLKFSNGLGVLCLSIAIIASLKAGARPEVAVYRSLLVWGALFVVQYIITRSWNSWEQMKLGDERRSK